MKHSAIIGALFFTVFSLGMAPSSESTHFSSFCVSPVFLNCLQPSKMSSDHSRVPGGMDKKTPRDSGSMRSQGTSALRLARPAPLMPADMVEHIMAVAKEIDPDLAAQLSLICESDPDAFQKICRRQGKRLGSLIRLRESDPELYEVKVTELKTDAEIYRVAEGLRGLDTEQAETQAKIAALQGLVRARTALSLRAQTLHLGRLEEHIQGLQDKLQDTTDRFDEIVTERVTQLLQSIKKTDKPNSPQAE